MRLAGLFGRINFSSVTADERGSRRREAECVAQWRPPPYVGGYGYRNMCGHRQSEGRLSFHSKIFCARFRFFSLRTPAVFFALLLVAPFAFAQDALTVLSSNATPPTVGMEGQLEVLLPETGLSAAAANYKSPVLLRIAAEYPHGTLRRYDLRYVGRVPGEHDLREYLIRTNGLAATNLPPLKVSVTGLLPEEHNGWLEEQLIGLPALFGGYKSRLGILLGLWAVGLVLIVRSMRRKKTPTAEAPIVQRPPSFSERLRPLVERAAAGQLSAEEKALLERMLLVHWQRRLNLRATSSDELIAQMRQHPEAGALIRALEDWLHRPPGSVKVEVESVLAPYRNLPDEQPETLEAVK